MEEVGFELGLRKECSFNRQGSKKKAIVLKGVTCRGTEVREAKACFCDRGWTSKSRYHVL